MTVQVTINTKVLDNIRANLLQRAEALLDKAARDIEGDAKELAPVDTGALRNSMHVTRGRLERTIADGVEYGLFVEMGTNKTGAQPFLIPSVERHRKPFLSAWDQLFR